MAKISDAHKPSFECFAICVVLLTSGFIASLNADEFLSQHYLGCFYNNITQKEDIKSSELSIEWPQTFEHCIQNCKAKSKSYARLQNGSYCECLDELGLQVNDLFCNKSCGENSTQPCDGTTHKYFSTYALYTVCPIGTYGSQCQNACHCKGGSSCNKNTGKCPNGCHGNYTGTNCSVLKSFSEQYIGCYKDQGLNRAMSHAAVDRDNNYMSLQRCTDLCSSKNYTFSGTQYSYECFCGESYNRHGPHNETYCSYTCTGSNEICGGFYACSVYNTCPSGYYGLKCAKVCNCQTGRCFFHNGTCQTGGCKSGWTGNACSLRDCNVNNGDCDAGEICVTVEPIVNRTISVCQCQDGYAKLTPGGNCIDIDECTEYPGICGPYAEFCSNIQGGYACLCFNGRYVKNSDCTTETDKSTIAMETGSMYPLEIVIFTAVGSGSGMAIICSMIGILVFFIHSKRSRREQYGQQCYDKNINRCSADANSDSISFQNLNQYQALNIAYSEDATVYNEIVLK